ncbi:MAG: DUF2017 domain-containing protein [Micrococcales bacterium]|nr:DUF2017 domain-containing protein [Micrococcales bacterium]
MRAFRVLLDASRVAYGARMSMRERRMLAEVVADVHALLEQDAPDRADDAGPAWEVADVQVPDDPAVARLLPDASHGDPEIAAEFRRLTQEDLRATKLAGLHTLTSCLETTPEGFSGDDLVVLAEDAPRVAAALTDVRLVLADRLGLHTDDDAEELHDELTQPMLRRRAGRSRRGLGDLYEALTWLQESLVVAMTSALPDTAGTP